MKAKIISIFTALTAVVALFSCDKMNDLHQPYLDRGETTYAARVDSIKAYIGIDKQVLELYYPAQRAVRGVIYWNLGANSQEFTLETEGHNPSKPLEITIEGLSEGNYTYEIYTYDAYDNISVPCEISCNVISQESYDEIVSNLCKSVYYTALDEAMANAGSGGGGVAAKVANCQNFNGSAWFSWDCDPIPGAQIHFEYHKWEGENKDIEGELVHRVVDGATISNGAWFSSFSDAICTPKDTHSFTYWTEFPGVEISTPIDEIIDLGEDYAEEYRYYHYTDEVKFEREGWTSAKTTDIW